MDLVSQIHVQVVPLQAQVQVRAHHDEEENVRYQTTKQKYQKVFPMDKVFEWE